MRTIRISVEVWDEIAKRGKFGETEDDVLRRVFGLKSEEGGQEGNSPISRPKHRRGHYSTNPMHAGVHSEHLVVSFDSGKEDRWKLPERSDKAEIRRIRAEAVKFALDNGASKPGQTNAVLKALTEAGYHLIK
jgi:hypothetical protein